MNYTELRTHLDPEVNSEYRNKGAFIGHIQSVDPRVRVGVLRGETITANKAKVLLGIKK